MARVRHYRPWVRHSRHGRPPSPPHSHLIWEECICEMPSADAYNVQSLVGFSRMSEGCKVTIQPRRSSDFVTCNVGLIVRRNQLESASIGASCLTHSDQSQTSKAEVIELFRSNQEIQNVKHPMHLLKNISWSTHCEGRYIPDTSDIIFD